MAGGGHVLKEIAIGAVGALVEVFGVHHDAVWESEPFAVKGEHWARAKHGCSCCLLVVC